MSISNVSVGVAFNVDELLTVELFFLFLDWVVVYCLGVYTFGFVPAVVRCVCCTVKLLFSLTVLSESQHVDKTM